MFERKDWATPVVFVGGRGRLVCCSQVTILPSPASRACLGRTRGGGIYIQVYHISGLVTRVYALAEFVGGAYSKRGMCGFSGVSSYALFTWG